MLFFSENNNLPSQERITTKRVTMGGFLYQKSNLVSRYPFSFGKIHVYMSR